MMRIGVIHVPTGIRIRLLLIWLPTHGRAEARIPCYFGGEQVDWSGLPRLQQRGVAKSLLPMHKTNEVLGYTSTV